MNDIASKNGVDVTINRHNRLYKKDSTVKKYQALEAFETFGVHVTCQYNHFFTNSKKDKTKSYGTEMSEDILAYRLLKSTKLSHEHEQLIKATLPELQCH